MNYDATRSEARRLLAATSVLVGLWTARYYADGRKRFGLPAWRELQSRV